MTSEEAKKSMIAQVEKELEERDDWLRLASLAQGEDLQLEASCVRLSKRAERRARDRTKAVFEPCEVDRYIRRRGPLCVVEGELTK